MPPELSNLTPRKTETLPSLRLFSNEMGKRIPPRTRTAATSVPSPPQASQKRPREEVEHQEQFQRPRKIQKGTGKENLAPVSNVSGIDLADPSFANQQRSGGAFNSTALPLSNGNATRCTLSQLPLAPSKAPPSSNKRSQDHPVSHAANPQSRPIIHQAPKSAKASKDPPPITVLVDRPKPSGSAKQKDRSAPPPNHKTGRSGGKGEFRLRNRPGSVGFHHPSSMNYSHTPTPRHPKRSRSRPSHAQASSSLYTQIQPFNGPSSIRIAKKPLTRPKTSATGDEPSSGRASSSRQTVQTSSPYHTIQEQIPSQESMTGPARRIDRKDPSAPMPVTTSSNLEAPRGVTGPEEQHKSVYPNHHLSNQPQSHASIASPVSDDDAFEFPDILDLLPPDLMEDGDERPSSPPDSPLTPNHGLSHKGLRYRSPSGSFFGDGVLASSPDSTPTSPKVLRKRRSSRHESVNYDETIMETVEEESVSHTENEGEDDDDISMVGEDDFDILDSPHHAARGPSDSPSPVEEDRHMVEIPDIAVSSVEDGPAAPSHILPIPYDVERVNGEKWGLHTHKFLIQWAGDWAGRDKQTWVDADNCNCPEKIEAFRASKRTELIDAHGDSADAIRRLADAGMYREADRLPLPKHPKWRFHRRNEINGRFQGPGLGSVIEVVRLPSVAPRRLRENTAVPSTPRAPSGFGPQEQLQDDEVVWVRTAVLEQPHFLLLGVKRESIADPPNPPAPRRKKKKKKRRRRNRSVVKREKNNTRAEELGMDAPRRLGPLRAEAEPLLFTNEQQHNARYAEVQVATRLEWEQALERQKTAKLKGVQKQREHSEVDVSDHIESPKNIPTIPLPTANRSEPPEDLSSQPPAVAEKVIRKESVILPPPSKLVPHLSPPLQPKPSIPRKETRILPPLKNNTQTVVKQPSIPPPSKSSQNTASKQPSIPPPSKPSQNTASKQPSIPPPSKPSQNTASKKPSAPTAPAIPRQTAIPPPKKKPKPKARSASVIAENANRLEVLTAEERRAKLDKPSPVRAELRSGMGQRQKDSLLQDAKNPLAGLEYRMSCLFRGFDHPNPYNLK